MSNRKAWEQKLKKIKDFKKGVEDADALFGSLPDGRYKAMVMAAEVMESNNNARLQIVVDLKILDHEEHADEETKSYMGLEKTSLSFTISTLKRLGYSDKIDPDDPVSLGEVVEDLDSSEKIVNIAVKQGFANIQNLAEDRGEGEPEDDEAPAETSSESEEAEEEQAEAEETSSEISEGTLVSWKGKDGEKQGEVIEVLEKENLARVDTGDGKIIRVSIDKLTIVVPATKDETEETEEDEREEEEVEEEKPQKTTVKKEMKKKKAPPARKVKGRR